MTEKVQYGQTLSLRVTKVINACVTSKTNVEYIETSNHGNVLFMDGEIQLSTLDEYRYHETLVHPVMKKVSGKAVNVLILGGGDGCAAREVYKWGNVASVTVVDHDENFVKEFGMGYLSGLNKNVFLRDTMTCVCQDASVFLDNTSQEYDVIFLDLPDPDSAEMKNLYSTLIMKLKWALTFNGVVGIHVGPALLDPSNPSWEMIANFRDMLLHTFNGQHPTVKLNTCYVPSFSNEWAFLHMHLGNYTVNPEAHSVAELCRYWSPKCDETLPLDIQDIYRRRL